MTESIPQEVYQYLGRTDHPQSFLATVDADGAPQVRPVTLMIYENAFYLATSKSSRKALQITHDKRVEFVAPFCDGAHNGYLRVMGLALPVDDLALVTKITTAHKYPVAEYWNGVDDPDFFCLQVTPTRVEYLKPGATNAVEVTGEFAE
jgi:general stress protein 26